MEKLDVKTDDIEQYSRRSCIRIHGIELDENTSSESVDRILSDCFQKINVPYDRNEIDRAHRIGKVVVDRVTGKSSRPIIVKFKSWKTCCEIYKARPKAYQNGTKKPGSNQLPFSVSLDLTKRRYQLLSRAKRLIEDNKKFNYAFSDINSSLGIKSADNRFLYFNTNDELKDIIGN